MVLKFVNDVGINMKTFREYWILGRHPQKALQRRFFEDFGRCLRGSMILELLLKKDARLDPGLVLQIIDKWSNLNQ